MYHVHYINEISVNNSYISYIYIYKRRYLYVCMSVCPWIRASTLALLIVYCLKISKFVFTTKLFQLSTFTVCKPVVTTKYFLLCCSYLHSEIGRQNIFSTPMSRMVLSQTIPSIRYFIPGRAGISCPMIKQVDCANSYLNGH